VRSEFDRSIPSRAELGNLSIFGATPQECFEAKLLYVRLYPDRHPNPHQESWETIQWQEAHEDEIEASPAGQKITELFFSGEDPIDGPLLPDASEIDSRVLVPNDSSEKPAQSQVVEPEPSLEDRTSLAWKIARPPEPEAPKPMWQKVPPSPFLDLGEKQPIL
jgi:hypothetical protein